MKNLCINQLKFEVPEGLFDKLANSKDKEDFPSTDIMAQIPGLKQAGWNAEESSELRKSKERSFQLQCQSIIDMLRKHKSVRHKVNFDL